MKVKDVMTPQVIRVSAQDTAGGAARMLAQYNVGMLPVVDKENKLCGVITDRDIAVRMVAAGQDPERTRVAHVMTGHVVTVGADMELSAAAACMAREQVRRLPVEDHGRLCGMLSLGDLAQQRNYTMEAADALAEISSNVSSR